MRTKSTDSEKLSRTIPFMIKIFLKYSSDFKSQRNSCFIDNKMYWRFKKNAKLNK